MTKKDFEKMVKVIGFLMISNNVYEKQYPVFDCSIRIDFEKELIIYPELSGLKITNHSTNVIKIRKRKV